MRWLKSSEVTKSGWYLIGRTDDQTFNEDIKAVRIVEFEGSFAYVESSLNKCFWHLDEIDEEVRWLGPIPHPNEFE